MHRLTKGVFYSVVTLDREFESWPRQLCTKINSAFVHSVGRLMSSGLYK